MFPARGGRFLAVLLLQAAWAQGEEGRESSVCEALELEDQTEGATQGLNLTEKLWLDCVCFAFGVVVATWQLLRSICSLVCRTGLRASCSRLSRWCCSCFKGATACCYKLFTHAHTDSGRRVVSFRRTSTVVGAWLTEGKPLAFTNYFRYLGTCCLTFLILFLVSQGLNKMLHIYELVPNTHTKDDLVAQFFLQPGSVFSHLTPENMDAIFGWVLGVVSINGVLFLVATALLEKWCDQPEVHEKVSRAIWVHGLPVKDQRLNPLVNEPFRLTFEELKQVERELGARFNDELYRKDPYKDPEPKRLDRDRNSPKVRKDRRDVSTAKKARASRRASGSFDRFDPRFDASRTPLLGEDNGEWVVDDWDAHLPHHQRQEPSDGLSVGNHIGAKGIFRDIDGRAVFVRKVLAASRVENVWVVPAARHWIEDSERLEEAFNQLQIYKLWLLAYQHPGKSSLWEKAWRSWYELRTAATEKRVVSLEDRLLRTRLKRLRMCGSAFVLFRDQDDCRSLLGGAPKWWHCKRWMCWFNLLKFGHVPFTSVTLEYEPAPHPNDINWQNMDTPRWFSETVFVLLTMVLMVFTLAGQAVLMWVLSVAPGGDKVSQHFASLMLLFINRSILPFPVEWIALAGKFRRRTEGELRQMHLNYWLLVTNTIVVPLLGLQIAQQIPLALNKNPVHFLSCVSFRLLRLPKRLFVGYLFDVTFLTNLYQVLAGSLFSCCSALQRSLTAVQPPNISILPPEVMKRVKAASGHKSPSAKCADSPPQYGFGYYYAWTLSIVALALLSSAEVPVTLLIAALCFFVKIVVDWYNLENKVYEIGPEHEGVLITWAIFYMRLCVSGWWFMTGLGVGQLCYDGTRVCPAWVMPWSFVLLALGGVAFGVSAFRIGFVIAVRRFFPGRLKQTTAQGRSRFFRPDNHLTWDAAPRIFHSTGQAEASQMFGSFTSFSDVSLHHPHTFETAATAHAASNGVKQKCRTAFAQVEAVVEEVHDRPFLEEFVQRFLAERLTVSEILCRIRRAEFRKAVTPPASVVIPVSPRPEQPVVGHAVTAPSDVA